MKKLLKYINLKDVVTNVATAAVILTLIACGGGKMLPGIVGATSRVVQLIHIPNSGHRIMPNSSKPVEAALFAIVGTPSQLAQSYDVQCTLFPGLPVPQGALIIVPGVPELNQNPNTCNATTDPNNPSPKSDGAGGRETFFDGSITTLIATGKTVSGSTFECRDIVNNLAVSDRGFTQAYIDPFVHQVKVFNESATGTVTQVPFACTGIGTDTDPVNTIEVQWAKQ